jgi:opacity protein-like surface antigen
LRRPPSSPPGVYVEVGAGAGWYPDTTWNFKVGSPADHHNEFATGEVFRGSVGTRLAYGLRGEIEGAFRSNAPTHTVAGGSPFGLDGQVRAYSVMANLFYDFKMASYRGITPFVGAGAGWAHLDVMSTFNVNNSQQADGTDNRFAWQLMAGVAIPLSEGISLTARYTYFDTVGDKMSVINQATLKPVDLPYNNHSATVGIRIGF